MHTGIELASFLSSDFFLRLYPNMHLSGVSTMVSGQKAWLKVSEETIFFILYTFVLLGRTNETVKRSIRGHIPNTGLKNFWRTHGNFVVLLVQWFLGRKPGLKVSEETIFDNLLFSVIAVDL